MRFFLAFMVLAGLVAAPVVEARMHAGPPVMHGQHRLRTPGAPPLDLIVSTPASAAYSFRKLRAAYGGKAAQLRRASDNAVLDIGFTGSGDFDTAAATTFCAATSCFGSVVWYDQSGNTKDLLQATAANQPQLLFNCQGALPCWQTTTALIAASSAASITPATGIVSFSVVGKRIGSAGFCAWLEENAPTTFNWLGTQNAANLWRLNGGGGGAGTFAAAPDNAFHAGQAVVNGAASVTNLDGVEIVDTSLGSTNAGVIKMQGANGATCNHAEAVMWDNYVLTPAERANLTANQRAYWGF